MITDTEINNLKSNKGFMNTLDKIEKDIIAEMTKTDHTDYTAFPYVKGKLEGIKLLRNKLLNPKRIPEPKTTKPKQRK